ncbi:MAG: DUF190 domain-containing protein [Xanthomonadales bacterium]|nr:DUF190 domain-containing protein [Xanthomonadales bacterium]
MSDRSELLRIYLGESDAWHGRPLFEAIVEKARELHLAGATVLRGPLGYGRSSRLHTSKILRLSDDLPLVVEIVESQEKIAAFLDAATPMLADVLVTIEKVRVVEFD